MKGDGYMNNYIFLTNMYLPKPGATGLCVHQLAKELVKDNNVYTICYEDGFDKIDYDGIKVIKIKIPSYLKNQDNMSKIKKKINIIYSLLKKTIYFYVYPLRSKSLIRRYKKNIEAIINNVKDGNIKIIASYTPLEAVVAAYEIKRKYKERVKIIYYSTDTLSNEQGDDGFLPSSYRTKCGLKWEKKLFELYDKVIIMECHKNHYLSSEFEQFKKKMHTANFPFLENHNVNKKIKINSKKEISMIYAGTLYRNLRNPSFMLNSLIEVLKEKEINIDIYGSGDCDDIVQNAIAKSKNKIKLNGMISHDDVLTKIYNADVLLSIGNKESPMVPSKIYEYMSTGKPIIHFYFYDGDPCIEPLKQYSNALLIKDNDKLSKTKILEFLKEFRQLEFKDVEKMFLTSTPKYTVDLLK